jgi:hypothetical protein
MAQLDGVKAAVAGDRSQFYEDVRAAFFGYRQE